MKLEKDQNREGSVVPVKIICILAWLVFYIWFCFKKGMMGGCFIYLLSWVFFTAFKSGKDITLIQNVAEAITTILMWIIWAVYLVYFFVVSGWLLSLIWIGGTVFISWIKEPIKIHFEIKR
ncbi:MAG: hypothetical protein Q4B70_01015 [Lachnospiraceae bacterium]|nr:hypothetical protein [Lachnospiraceae bacterium]